MNRSSYRLVLTLLCLATITSSLGIERSSEAASRQRRRRTAISIPSFDASGVNRSPSSSDGSDAMRLLQDEKRFPAKRRWNSGNLRVWGKRSSAVPDISSLEDQLYGHGDEGPLWLLPARLTNKEQAPVEHAQSIDGPDVNSGLWNWLSPGAQEKRRWTKRSNEQSWKNVPWL